MKICESLDSMVRKQKTHGMCKKQIQRQAADVKIENEGRERTVREN